MESGGVRWSQVESGGVRWSQVEVVVRARMLLYDLNIKKTHGKTRIDTHKIDTDRHE